MTQKQALKLMLSGGNVFLTGPPGSGKTYLLNEFIRLSKERGLKVAVTATTGIAATHLNGLTIHSWSGIGINDGMKPDERQKLSKNWRLSNRYKTTDALVIDEVSMLDGKRLDLINELAKLFRGVEEPMGGMRLILVGDLFQLPPVNANANSHIFNSKAWDNLNLKICYLSEQHRQQLGDELSLVLEAIRSNRVGQAELAVLKSKINSPRYIRRSILRLYSHNFDADRHNDGRFSMLKTKEKLYKMRTKGSSTSVATLKSAILSPELLKLRVGCEVIFTANNYEASYVNGDRGRVVDFKSNWPIVRLNRGTYLRVEQYNWRTELDDQVIAEAWQLPLKLAWAITIHKSQGMSLDEAEIDLSRAFSPGMGYVALSRLRNIDGLYLLGLNKMALYVDNNILKLDAILRAESDKLVLR